MTTHNQEEINTGDTFYQGDINISYKELKKFFGKPTEGDKFKIDAKWSIKVGDIVATIYNYKTGRNYLGKNGTPKTKIEHWHVGGFNKTALDVVKDLIEF